MIDRIKNTHIFIERTKDVINVQTVVVQAQEKLSKEEAFTGFIARREQSFGVSGCPPTVSYNFASEWRS